MLLVLLVGHAANATTSHTCIHCHHPIVATIVALAKVVVVIELKLLLLLILLVVLLLLLLQYIPVDTCDPKKEPVRGVERRGTAKCVGRIIRLIFSLVLVCPVPRREK